MNLVGAYDSSSDDDDDDDRDKASVLSPSQEQPGPLPKVAGTNNERKIVRSKGEMTSSTATSINSGPMKKRKRERKKSSNTTQTPTAAKSRRKKTKAVVNALVLSPEIQAALARGDTLGDSDSDESPANKPPKVLRPAGSNPNDLLSLLPQPSTSASADDIFLKSQLKRRKAATAKSAQESAQQSGSRADKGSEAASQPTKSSEEGAAPPPAPPAGRTTARIMPTGQTEQGNASEEESDSDDGDDLLANMHAKSSSTATTPPLFTLPSRAKVLPIATTAATSPPLKTSDGAVVPLGGGAAGTDQAHVPAYFDEDETASKQSMGQWERQGVHPQGGPPVDQRWTGALHTGAGGTPGAVVASTWERPQQQSVGKGYESSYQGHQGQALYYPSVTAQTTSFGSSAQGGITQDGEFGVERGGKKSRRQGRDMERALASGDLGALGNELPVMDLHQGSNEYNPLRTKPITAAMKQDQKHIEGSVYDPRTGKTVKTLEPTSTQKRKHQINQLAVQAASMERDLMERSGASRLTKAQTHAKYGW